MNNERNNHLTPSAEEIKEALEKMLRNEHFNSSPRISQFLRHLVDKTLAGETAQLTSSNLGPDVFDRGPDYNPQDDSIVRVQARRLRQMLSIYFLTTGRFDSVHIEIPKGSYVPKFSRNAIRFLPSLTNTKNTIHLKETLTIMPFTLAAFSHDPQVDTLGLSLQASFQDILMHRFFISGLFSTFVYKRCDETDFEIDDRPIDTTYCLRGSLQSDKEKLHITASLLRASDQFVLWSTTYTCNIEPELNFLTFAEETATDIVKQIKTSASE